MWFSYRNKLFNFVSDNYTISAWQKKKQTRKFETRKMMSRERASKRETGGPCVCCFCFFVNLTATTQLSSYMRCVYNRRTVRTCLHVEQPTYTNTMQMLHIYSYTLIFALTSHNHYRATNDTNPARKKRRRKKTTQRTEQNETKRNRRPYPKESNKREVWF